MKLAVTLLVASLLAAPAAFADKSYQKTGTVVDVNDKAVVIDTGKEGNWEFKRDAGTKMEGDVKKGAKVTVQYSMTASKVEAKAEKKKDDKKK
jgi:RNase P/RNase MRP subunit p29